MTIVFSPFAVAADPWYSVSLSYLTDILQAEDGTEQRVMLRVIPVREHAFTVRTLKAQHTGWLDALTYGNQSTQLAVPHWPHGTFLAANASAGSSVVLSVADTSDRDFVIGGYAVVWQSDAKAEECTITGVTGSSVTVSTLANSYTRGAFVMPSYRGKIKGDLDLSRFHASMAEVPVTFTMEHQTDPAIDLPDDAEVFSTVPYMRVDVSEALARQVTRVESATYTYGDYPTRFAPIGTRPFKVWVNTRATANDLIEWFQSVRGRNRTFYLPTYQDDLKVLSGLGTTSVTIERSGYSAYLAAFPERKVLSAIEPNGTVTQGSVVTATDNGVITGTETLTLDVTVPAGTSLLSYTLYGRLESDTLELKWQNNTHAICELGFVECPAELAPTEFEEPGSGGGGGTPGHAVGPVDPTQCTASVPNGQDEVATLFTVTARDSAGQWRRTGGDTVAASVTGANTATPTITDLDNGLYRGRYTPHNTGTDLVAITLNGVAIRNSPYTSIVGTTPVNPPNAMPYGFWASTTWAESLSYAASITSLRRSCIPSNVIALASACFAAGCTFSFSFPRETVKDSAGRFSLSRFQSMVDAVAGVSGVNTYINNGTLFQHMIIDDLAPKHWGGTVPSFATLSSACAYSKAVWGTVKTMIRKVPTSLIGMENLDHAHCQYKIQDGSIDAYLAPQERAARTIGCRLGGGIHISDGGNGSSGIATGGGRYAMSATEILRYGQIVASSSMVDYFQLYRYHNGESFLENYYASSSIQNAVDDLGDFCAGEIR